ncbi:Glycine cleavage system transcriptional activator GcvA [Castellaniella defragrans 65Phen]|uniref:Glycine cleavage system transcriptional activator GcvA n=1 Tax=Castellaniella defragrans (strain DSM 12143 / CCUG 39792 / 65Phen) TaxID=1437824 RepID=W8X2C3_CASD6|nr:LysR substrate-binding domain-containing protein [Castellaniella defragrans]CDM23096.1 Glycine cleavage system transcriptional activator GcvA [Castellaniella defragrans 65Phen]
MLRFAHQNLRLPSLATIQAFESAARLGSFGRAAEELCVTASAIGKRIGQLEAALGQPLFDRGSRGVVLTAAGHEYLDQIETALHLLSDISLHRRSRPRERIRLVTTPTFGHYILGPHLHEFTTAHPNVDMSVVLSIPYLDIGPTQADFWVRFGLGRYPGTISERLTDDTVFPACSPGYLERHGALRRPADLAEANLLRCPLDPWKPWFDAAGLDWPEPEGGVSFFDVGLAMAAARAGQGVIIARRSLAGAWLDDGTLVAPFGIRAAPDSHYYLCREASTPMTGAHLAFSLWVKALCARISQSF